MERRHCGCHPVVSGVLSRVSEPPGMLVLHAHFCRNYPESTTTELNCRTTVGRLCPVIHKEDEAAATPTPTVVMLDCNLDQSISE